MTSCMTTSLTAFARSPVYDCSGSLVILAVYLYLYIVSTRARSSKLGFSADLLSKAYAPIGVARFASRMLAFCGVSHPGSRNDHHCVSHPTLCLPLGRSPGLPLKGNTPRSPEVLSATRSSQSLPSLQRVSSFLVPRVATALTTSIISDQPPPTRRASSTSYSP